MSTTSDSKSRDGECGSVELEQTATQTCRECGGTGKIEDALCEQCAGSGTETIWTKVSCSRCLPAED